MRFISLFLFFLLICIKFSLAQTTYSSSPNPGTYRSCSGSNTNQSCGFHIGNTIQTGILEIQASRFVFRVRKCDRNAFTSSGTIYIKEGGICGSVVGSRSVSSGNTFRDINVNIPNSFTSGTRNYYATVISSTGDRFWAGPIPVTASTTSTINITEPDGGESYTAGSSSIPIQWNSSGIGSSVSIELTNTSNVTQRTIVDPTSNDGFYSWSIPSSVSAGSYRIKIYETGTGNGVRYSGTITINQRPDFRIFSSTISPSTITQGNNSTVNYTLSNNGGSPGRTSRVGFILSTDNSISSNDINLGTQSIGSSFRGSSALSKTFTFDQTPGNYTLFIVADVDSDVTESSESNNIQSVSLTIRSVPVLEFVSCITAPSSVTQNTTLSGVSMRVENKGQTGYSGTVIISLNQVDDASNSQEIYRGSVNLSAGLGRTFGTGSDIVNLSPGTYRITLAYTNAPNGGVDFARRGSCSPSATATTGTVYHYKNITVTAPVPPQLEFTQCINAPNPNLQEGESYGNITLTLRNIGTSTYTGSATVLIFDPSNSSNNQSLTIRSLSLAPNATQFISTGQVTANRAPGTYRVAVAYNNAPNGGSDFVRRGSCTPSATHSSGTAYHYQTITIQEQVVAPQLEFSTCITAPTSVASGGTLSGVSMQVRNIGTSTWSGTAYVVVSEVGNTSNFQNLYQISTSISSNGNRTFATGSDVINLAPGSYRIYTVYTNAPGGGSSFVQKGSCSPSTTGSGVTYHYKSITIGNPTTGNCNSFTDLANSGNDTEAYAAAQCLCNLGYITPQNHSSSNNNGIKPNEQIFRADLAKLVYFTLYKGNSASPADNFPVPFVDLQRSGDPYYRYAKALSYLQYDDNRTPFDRDFVNFNPYSTILRKYGLKVIMEAFDLEPDNEGGADAEGYMSEAVSLGLLTVRNDNQPLLRRDAMIIMHRIVSELNGSACNTSYSTPNPNAADYYTPGNFTDKNMNRSVGASEGYFTHTAQGQINIPSIGMPLVFSANYSSYYTELPQISKGLHPLGKGWKHPYNSYIVRASSPATGISEKAVVFWASGGVHVYNVSNRAAETDGVFDEITSLGSTIIRIKKKNQVVYTFTKYGPNPTSPYLLTRIEDRNGNAIVITMETANDANVARRIDYVTGTTGRRLNFFYYANSDCLSRVDDQTGSRRIRFSISNDHLVSVTDLKGNRTNYSYYNDLKSGLISNIYRPESNVINIEYNPNRTLRYTRIMDGSTEIYRMDANVNRNYGGANPVVTSRLTDANTITDYTYTGNGYLSRMTSTNGGTQHFQEITYGSSVAPNLPSKVKMGSSSENIDLDYIYDSDGNPTRITLPNGTYHQYTYNTLNDVTQYRDPRGKITRYFYDSNDNLDYVSDPLGFITNFTISNRGLVTSVRNPENITYSFGYNSRGDQTSMNGPLGINSTAAFDAIGRRTRFTNPKGQVMRYLYDAHDLVTRTTRESSGGDIVTINTYDKNDNLESIRNAKNGLTSFDYDDGDVLRSMTFGNDTKRWEYYKNGQLKNFRKPDGTNLASVYDDLGRLTNDGYATYTYYDDGTLRTIGKNGTTRFNYDNLNRLDDYTDIYGKNVDYGYDANGNRTRITYPGGLRATYTYDDNNRMTRVSWAWNGQTYFTNYTYRKDGLVKTATNSNGTNCTYTYDAAGRMTGIAHRKSNNAIINSYTFTLDKLGNHLTENKSEPYGVPPYATASLSGTYNGENEVSNYAGTSFTFDANGNQTRKGSTNMTFDQRDLLTRLGGSNYLYDGSGLLRRAVRGGTTTKYVWDAQGMGNILMETNNGGTATAYYLHGQGMVAKIDVARNQVYFYHHDYRGSTIAMTSNSQSIVNKYNYDAFGKVMEKNETVPNRFCYVGRWGVMDEGDGYLYMRARFYDSETGRFLSEDPVWHTNLYGYAGGNPVMMVDFEGATPVLAEDQALWDKYLSVKGMGDQAIGNAGMTSIEFTMRTLVDNLGMLVGEATTPERGAKFITGGRKTVSRVFKAFTILEITYDAFLNPEFIPKVGEADAYYLQIIDMNNEIASINRELNILAYRYSNDDELNIFQKSHLAKAIKFRLKLRNNLTQARDIFSQQVKERFEK